MKLLSIYADNYGLFHGRHLEFRDQFQVIYGPNEAGKSTLLQLIRESLFGFPHISPYRWRTSSKMAATVRLELQDGQKLQFRRQKGKPDDVTGGFEGSQAKLQSHEDLLALFTGATAETFTNIFGFSLEELSKGQESLKNSGLGDLLLTGGVNGLDQFRRIQKELFVRQEEIFAPRARTRKLNQVLSNLNDARKRYQDQRIAPRDFDQLTLQREVCQSKVDELSKHLVKNRQQEKRIERFTQALPVQRAIEVLQGELQQLCLPEGLSQTILTQINKLLVRHQALLSEIEELKESTPQELKIPTSETQNLDLEPQVDQQLLSKANEIQQLAQDVKQIRAFLKEKQTQAEEQTTLQREIDRRLAELGDDWTIEKVHSLSLGLPFREQLHELSERESELNQSRIQLEARVPDLEQQLAQIRNTFDSLPTTRSISGLEDLLQRAESYRRDCHALADLKQELADVVLHLKSVSRELGTAFGSQRENWDDVPVPLKSTIQEWSEKFTLAKQKLQRSIDQFNEKQATFKQLQQNLNEFDQLHPSLDRESLLQRRAKRDRGLDLMILKLQMETTKKTEKKRKETEQLIQDWMEDSTLEFTETLLQRVAETDHLADIQYSQAEFVARRDQLVNQVEILEGQLVELAEQESRARDDLKQLEGDWRQIWELSEIVPLSPVEMLEWLQIFDQWKSLSQKQSQLEQRQTSLTDAVSSFETELSRTFPIEGTSADQALRLADKELRESHRNLETRERLQLEESQLSQKLEDLESVRFNLTLQQGEFDSQRRVLLKQIGFPEQWSLKVAQRVLGAVLDLQRDTSEAEELSTALSARESQIDEFTAQARMLIEQLDDKSSAIDVCDAVDAMYQKLLENQQLDQAQAKALALKGEQQRRLSLLEVQRTEILAELDGLQRTLNLKSIDDLNQLVDKAAQQQKLQEQLRHQRQQLLTIAGDYESLESEFGNEDSSIEMLQEELVLQTQRCEHDYAAALKELGVLQNRIDQLAQQRVDDSALREWSHHRSVLNETVQNWSALAISQRVLRQAQQRFEEENQPEMMRLVSHYFERMTEGRYVGIQTDFEHRRGLVVLTENQETKLPGELSTGTREQLYLAVRLGYLSHYSEKHEPLPLVMDDVLVNFDDNRALQTLEVLKECSVDHQILLLTCHTRTVELMHRLNREARILELIPGSLEGLPSRPPAVEPQQTKRRPKDEDHAQPALFPNS